MISFMHHMHQAALALGVTAALCIGLGVFYSMSVAVWTQAVHSPIAWLHVSHRGDRICGQVTASGMLWPSTNCSMLDVEDLWSFNIGWP